MFYCSVGLPYGTKIQIKYLLKDNNRKLNKHTYTSTKKLVSSCRTNRVIVTVSTIWSTKKVDLIVYFRHTGTSSSRPLLQEFEPCFICFFWVHANYVCSSVSSAVFIIPRLLNELGTSSLERESNASEIHPAMSSRVGGCGFPPAVYVPLPLSIQAS